MDRRQISIVGDPTWTFLQNKIFENGLLIFPEGTPDRWVKIAATVPGKTRAEVESHYAILVRDLQDIKAGKIKLLRYDNDSSKIQDSDAQPSSSTNEERRFDCIYLEVFLFLALLVLIGSFGLPSSQASKPGSP
ncbi:protein RADIALIS-like 4 [Malania oleifera]|uniref:protein RADIALIS-like 4 n=1 Tax=Malania oleifera TaxID=397392 RepID=UPI0025AE2C99|nr:protein RADIALIS-like 4 [Malania oleifera]